MIGARPSHGQWFAVLRNASAAFICGLAVAGAITAQSIADTPPPSTTTATTTTPATTVIVPDAIPPGPTPRPDPGPIKTATQPKHVRAAHQQPQPSQTTSTPRLPAPTAVSATPAVPASGSVTTPPVAPAVTSLPTPRKKRSAPRPASVPHHPRSATPAPRHVSHPRHVAPTSPAPTPQPATNQSRVTGTGISWTVTALVVAIAMGLAIAAMFGVLRGLRKANAGGSAAPAALAVDQNGSSSNGDRELAQSNGHHELAQPDDQRELAQSNGHREWTQTPSDPVPAVIVSPSPAQAAATVARCTIGWWRGYVRSQFVAATRGDNGDVVVVAESPAFAWRSKQPPPQTGAAVSAHKRLVETLAELGWEAVQSGPHWFDVTFEPTPIRSPASQSAHQPAPV